MLNWYESANGKDVTVYESESLARKRDAKLPGRRQYQGEEITTGWGWGRTYLIKIHNFPWNKSSYCKKDKLKRVPTQIGMDFKEPRADFNWTISEDLMDKFEECEPKEHVDSELYESRQQLTWYLRAYPNGLDEHHEEDFRLFLKLHSGLKPGQSVLACCYLGCKQNNLDTFIASHCCLTKHMMTENGSIECKSDNGWPEGSLSLRDVLNSYSFTVSKSTKNPIISRVTFYCALRILRICDFDGGILYEYPFNLGDFDRHDKLEWNISQSLARKLGKQKDKVFFPPLYSTSTMSPMFYLSVYRDDSGLSVFVNVLTLPIGVQYIDIKAEAHFVPLGKKRIETKKEMHYDWRPLEKMEHCDKNGAPRQKRSASRLCVAVCDSREWASSTKTIDESLDIEVKVSILKMYDEKKEEVVFPTRSDYVLTITGNDEYKGNGDYYGGVPALVDQKENDAHTENLPKLEKYEIRSKKVLAAIVTVHDYVPYNQSTNNLSCTFGARMSLINLFQKFGYTVMVLDRARITFGQFKKFIWEVRYKMSKHHSLYDAFIFVFVGHGHEHSIMLSDGKAYSRVDLYQYFNGENCQKFKEKTKIMLLEACKMPGSPERIKSKRRMEHHKKQVQHSRHPDDRIAIFESNSDGYESFSYGVGGALISSFIKVMNSIEERMRLDDIKVHMQLEIEKIREKYAKLQVLNARMMGFSKTIYICAPENDYAQTIQCRRVLAAIITVNEYKPYHSKKNNAPHTVADRKGLINLFRRYYRYKVMQLDQDRITLDDFKEFIENVRAEMNRNHKKYDALIFAFSGHGNDDSIVLSDGEGYGRVDIYKYFDVQKCPRFTDKLKLFLIDTCKGDGHAMKSSSRTRAVIRNGQEHGVQCTTHQDSNIAIFSSNNQGGGGGALMTSFIKVMRANRQKLPLDMMMRYTQQNVRALSKMTNTMPLLDCIMLGIEKDIYFDVPKYSETNSMNRMDPGLSAIVKDDDRKFDSPELMKTQEPEFVWSIPPILHQKFKKAPSGKSFESSRFISGQNLEWYLRVYPNGINKNEKGHSTLCLMLSSKLKENESVIVCAYCKCEQTNASVHWLREYVLKKNGYVGCERGEGWYNGTLSFSELSNLDSVSFSCSIQIQQIRDVGGNVTYEHPLKLKNIPRRQVMKWHLDQSLVRDLEMKKDKEFYAPISVLSDDSMFFLSAKRVDSDFRVYFYLRTLPIGVCYVDIGGTVQCVQIGEAIEWSIKSRHYDLDRKEYGNSVYIRLFDDEDWKELTDGPDCSLDIEVTINILKCYDSEKKEIPFPKNMKSLTLNGMLSNNDYKENGDDNYALTSSWNITPFLHRKFKKAPPGKSFESSRFVSERNLEWYLKVYPNGLNENEKGNCTLCLKLSSKLKGNESVIVCAYYHCEHTNGSVRWLREYVLKKNGYVGCETGEGWYTGTLSFSELSNLDSVSFSCSIQIQQIRDVGGNVTYEHPLKLKNIPRRQVMKWHIDQSLVRDLKMKRNKELFASIPVDVQRDDAMFFLSTKRTDSGFAAILNLCTLPIGVQYVDIAASAQCVQIGEAKSRTKNLMHYDADQQSANYIWITLCDNEDWEKLTEQPQCSLDIEVTINILKCYDLEKKEIPFAKSMK